MAYQKIGFKNGDVLTAEQLIHMEDGIIDAEKKPASGGGTGTGLPSDVGAYKYMATDGEGNWVADDRLAYPIPDGLVLIPEQTITPGSWNNVHESEPENGFGALELGKKYTVVFDGVRYPDLVAILDDWYGPVGLGNGGGLTGSETMENNGLPFFVSSSGEGDYYVFTADANEHTIGLFGVGYKTIDVDNLAFKIRPGTGYRSEVFNDGNPENSSGECSHAEGKETTASGECSHAEGKETTASGLGAHAEGFKTTASYFYSHSEGQQTTATGNSSHAEGNTTVASNTASHAEGEETTASGYGSHAEGYGTIAAGYRQHVQGEYNIAEGDTGSYARSKYAHIVGNGTSNTKRSNAHTLDWNGNAWFAGGIELTSPNGTRYRFTVSDDGTLSGTVVTE